MLVQCLAVAGHIEGTYRMEVIVIISLRHRSKELDSAPLRSALVTTFSNTVLDPFA